jgi:hypothetical protein
MVPIGCGAASSLLSLAVAGSVLLSAGCASKSAATDAGKVQCTTTSDCVALGGAFAKSVCVHNVCSIPDSGPVADACRDAPDARVDATRSDATPSDAPRSDVTVPVDARPTNDWSCLGHVQWPDASSGRETLVMGYQNEATRTPIAGITVRPCAALDPTCTTAVAEGGVTNEAGLVTLSVPSGFNGYLASDWDATLPMLLYVTPPVFTNTVAAPAQLMSKPFLEALASAMGAVDGATVTINPNDGLFLLGTWDCAMVRAAGVTFSWSPSPPSIVMVYLVDGLPSPAATSTDSAGGAAAINVPPGTYTITATVAADHRVIGTMVALSEAGYITEFSSVPTPSQ